MWSPYAHGETQLVPRGNILARPPKRRVEEVVYARPFCTFALKIHERHCVSSNWEEALACRPLD